MAKYLINMYKTPIHRVRFNVPINGKNIPILLLFRYNSRGNFWHMDVCDGRTNEILIANAPIVRGADDGFNILRQFEHLGIGSAFTSAASDNISVDTPDYNTFLDEFKFVWGDYDD